MRKHAAQTRPKDIRERPVKSRLTDHQAAALRDALAGDGLIWSSIIRAWTARIPPADQSKPGGHIDGPVFALAEMGWLVMVNDRGRYRRKSRKPVRLSDHARERLARSLLEAGLFVTRDEIMALSETQRAQAAVWADAQLSGYDFSEALFFWLEVMRRTPPRMNNRQRRLFNQAEASELRSVWEERLSDIRWARRLQ